MIRILELIELMRNRHINLPHTSIQIYRMELPV